MRRGAQVALAVGLVAVGGVAFSQAEPTARSDAHRAEIPWGTARELTELAERLERRERDLDHRERSVVERESSLRDVEGALSERLARLEVVRAEIAALLDGVEETREDRVLELVRRVEAMRDAQAAAVLSETEPELAVEVLRRMAPSKAGKALAKMVPTTAARLGERMATPDVPPEIP